MTESLELHGTIEKLLFHNEQNGYAVFVLQVTNAQSAVVCGHLTQIHAGQHITAIGNWITHPKFGKQFQATQCTVQAPTSIIGLKKYLFI